jgi:hypothetical protein
VEVEMWVLSVAMAMLIGLMALICDLMLGYDTQSGDVGFPYLFLLFLAAVLDSNYL